MSSYQINVEAAEHFAHFFNTQQFDKLETLLDKEVIFSVQNIKGVNVGTKPVIKRVKQLINLAKKKDKTIVALAATIDLFDLKAQPCVLVSSNEQPERFFLGECNPFGKIFVLSELNNALTVKEVKPLEA